MSLVDEGPADSHETLLRGDKFERRDCEYLLPEASIGRVSLQWAAACRSRGNHDAVRAAQALNRLQWGRGLLAAEIASR